MFNACQKGHVYGSVKDAIDSCYGGSYEAVGKDLDYHIYKFAKSLEPINHLGATYLNFPPLEAENLDCYISNMTDYERQRCRKWAQQFVKRPEIFPFTEILERKFRKHQPKKQQHKS